MLRSRRESLASHTPGRPDARETRAFRTTAAASRVASIVMLLSACAQACAHEELRFPVPPEVEKEAPLSVRSPPSYIVADPSPFRPNLVPIPLRPPGTYGLIVDKRRLVLSDGEPRLAPDATPDAIAGVSKLPARWGGGFLFWTANTIYRAVAFDSTLIPLVRVPDTIEAISFAPKSLLVRTHNGERWGVALPSGERVPLSPLGLADVQALDDGRAIAFDDRGAVFTSLNHGVRWNDVTAQVRSTPTKVAIVDEELWLHEASGASSRLEPFGTLSWFDRAPIETPIELRPRDPRWRGVDTPLRTVFKGGAALDESTAIVVDSGDVVRVDVRTGAVLSVVRGRLPADAACEAVPVPGDILFACTSRMSNGSAFVASHTLASEAPTIEQTFAAGGKFFSSDDGGLAYSGSCQGISSSTVASTPVVCVRLPGGRWEERDLAALPGDSGASSVEVARWVPRADGHVVALVVSPNVGVYDPSTAELRPLPKEVQEVLSRGYSHRPGATKTVRYGRYKRSFGTSNVVDSSWSYGSDGVLRGWQRGGDIVSISQDGRLTRSPYELDIVVFGPFGVGRSEDNRLYQSLDHGASWVEVAPPPAGVESIELVSCSSAGCDLGSFYRVGWSSRTPRTEPPTIASPSAPEIRRSRAVELSCRPRGASVSRMIPRTVDSPEDLGLGAQRLPVSHDRAEWSYLRTSLARGIVSPVHELTAGEGDGLPSLRVLFSGYATSTDGDRITVAGPNKDPMALRRGISFVAPFDPSGTIVRTSIAMAEVVSAGHRAGMTTEEILQEDLTESGLVVPLVTPEPNAPSYIAIHNVDRGMLAVFRGDRARVSIRPSQNSANVVSGVVLGSAATSDEMAFLEVDSSGGGRVFKVGGGGVSELFEVGAFPDELLYPANPDALALGPKGELAIVRTPSGSDPPSTLDPAFVVAPGAAPEPLGPWSTLAFADDPACKAEVGGYRTVLQIVSPWIRVATPDLRVEDYPMIARVRWTSKRVCLEGVEVKLPSVPLRLALAEETEPLSVASWLVGKGSTFTRVAIGEGIEWRQPLECSIVKSGS